MKRKLCGCLLVGILAVFMSLPVFADEINGGDDFVVNFTSNNRLVTNYTNNELSQSISGLQPGDSITYKFTLKNSNSDAVYYYMSSSALKSFEESDASPAGGAYGYELIYYDDQNNETVLYRSQSIGGDGKLDFKTAANNFSDYIYLDTMEKGDKGMLKLVISLDGETEGNAYQSAAAILNMSFAVETGVNPKDKTPTPGKNGNPKPVKTGDYSYLYIYAAIAVALGIIILIIAIIKLKKDRKEEDEEEAEVNEKV